MNLRGVLARGWDGIRYCPKAKRSFISIMLIIDQTILPEVSDILSVDDVKQLPIVSKKYVYFIKSRRTFEIQYQKIKGGIEFSSCDVEKDGKLIVYEYGLDRAVEALKSGMQVNPGPTHLRTNPHDWTVPEIWILLREKRWVVFDGNQFVRVQFPLFCSYRFSDASNVIGRIASDAGNQMIKWAGSIDSAIVKWAQSSSQARAAYLADMLDVYPQDVCGA
jgi:hypothetical protein